MSRPSHCKHCGITWNGLEIPDGLVEGNPGRYVDRVDAEADAANYGWTHENKRTFGVNVVGLYDMGSDRTELWHCENCKRNTPR